MTDPNNKAECTFVFKDWCQQHELDSNTVTILVKEKLDVASALETLSREDICSLELPLGQRNLVMKGVRFLTGHHLEMHSLGANALIDSMQEEPLKDSTLELEQASQCATQNQGEKSLTITLRA